MTEQSRPKIGANARRLFLWGLVPAAWIVFLSLIPDFVARNVGHGVPLIQGLSSGIGILLLLAYAAYLIRNVGTERSTSVLITSGILLIAVSETFRVLKATDLIDLIITPSCVNPLRALDNLINGLGLVLIALAFVKTIITLFVSRQRLADQRRQLLDEVERRKQTESELRERETLLDGISTSAFDGIVVIDNAGYVKYWNPSAERILGYRAEEAIGRPVHELLVPFGRHREEYLEGWSAWKSQGQGVVTGKTLSFTATRQDGAQISVELSLSSLRISDEWHAVAILRDITERRRSEEALRLLKIAIEQVGDGVGIVDLQGCVVFVNNAWAAMHGRSADGLVGQNLSIFHTAEQLATDVAQVLARVVKEGSCRAEVGHCREDGSCFQTMMTTTQLRDANGNSTGYIGIARDITELQEAHRQLDQQRAAAFESARLASLGLMASGIAHEINNPLAIIGASAEKLEDFLSTPETDETVVNQLLPMIQRNITRITKVIRGLRSLSHDASRDPCESAAIRNIVEDVVELCRERFRLHDVDFRIQEPIPPVTVECRASEIGQVLLNLLNNAFDAVKERAPKWVAVSVLELPESVEISVEDSGLGIPEEVAERLFLPFYTTKLKEHGLGLGLSISRGIVEAHQGALTLDAESEHTKFVMRLPKHQSPLSNAT